MKTKRYPSGIFYNDPRENAPDFVKGSISIKKDDALEWLDKEKPNDKGYVNLDLLISRENKPYLTVNEYHLKSLENSSGEYNN